MMEKHKEAMTSNINKEPMESSEDVEIETMIITIQENSSSYSVAFSKLNKNFKNFIADAKVEEKFKELLKIIVGTLERMDELPDKSFQWWVKVIKRV